MCLCVYSASVCIVSALCVVNVLYVHCMWDTCTCVMHLLCSNSKWYVVSVVKVGAFWGTSAMHRCRCVADVSILHIPIVCAVCLMWCAHVLCLYTYVYIMKLYFPWYTRHVCVLCIVKIFFCNSHVLVFKCVACSVMRMCELGGGFVVQADTDIPGVLDINKPVHLYISWADHFVGSFFPPW